MLSQSVKGIADIITKPGYINVDFADLKAIMKNMGLAVMGTGRAKVPIAHQLLQNKRSVHHY